MLKISQKNEALELLQELIRIPSPYFKEANIMKFARFVAQDYHLPVQIHNYEFEPLDFKGQNLYGLIDGGDGPFIYLGGHLDTVQEVQGWTRDPLGAEIEGNLLYGTGALDMKAGCAAILYTLKIFTENYPKFKGKILYHFASVEEGPYSLGTTFFLNEILKEDPDLAIITEPSSGLAESSQPNISIAAKGGYNYKIHLEGLGAHAATPEKGISAAEDASKLVLKLNHVDTLEDELLGKGASCVIALNSSSGAASVPDKATIEVFRHVVPGESKETIIEEIKKAIKEADIRSKYTISFRKPPLEGFDGGFPPYKSDPHHPYIRLLSRVTKEVLKKTPEIGYSKAIGDFNLIGGVRNIPTVLFGPMGKNYHSADEYVEIDSYYQVIEVLYKFLEELLV